MFQMLPEMPMAAKFFVAFVIVLALIGLTAWLVRRFGANRLGANTRGRQPRLAVIDAATVDGRRRLVLIRRDNVEHLMMIGGPNDLIIEPNIVRAVARDAGREAQRAAPMSEPQNSWPLQPAVEPPPAPMPTAAPRTAYRPPVTEEPWIPAEPPREANNLRPRPSDSITNMAAEFSARLNSEFEPPARPVPPPPREPVAAAPAPAPIAPPQTDHNLAEMAQRLEAALRRPAAAETHSPVTDPLAAAPAMKAPEPPRVASLREFKAEPRAEFRQEAKFEPKLDTKPAPSKDPFDSLEEEMASLLGRQPGKT